jgi:hypothetical protein
MPARPDKVRRKFRYKREAWRGKMEDGRWEVRGRKVGKYRNWESRKLKSGKKSEARDQFQRFSFSIFQNLIL